MLRALAYAAAHSLAPPASSCNTSYANEAELPRSWGLLRRPASVPMQAGSAVIDLPSPRRLGGRSMEWLRWYGLPHRLTFESIWGPEHTGAAACGDSRYIQK